MIVVLAVIVLLDLATPALAATPTLPPKSIANPAPIPPSLGVAWFDAKIAALVTLGQSVATPVATVAVLAAGFALLVGWLFSAHMLRQVAQWLIFGVLGGYFLVMAAPRLVLAMQGWVLH